MTNPKRVQIKKLKSPVKKVGSKMIGGVPVFVKMPGERKERSGTFVGFLRDELVGDTRCVVTGIRDYGLVCVALPPASVRFKVK